MHGGGQFFRQSERSLPDSIDDIIADLAVVFHWTPDTCHAMPLDELMAWHDKARERSQVKK